jgi:hypothetical protein
VLAFTSIYFSESGLFNGLRAMQIKNSPSFPDSRGGCDQERFKQPRLLLARLLPGAWIPPMRKHSACF